jgi:hypothetical protein
MHTTAPSFLSWDEVSQTFFCLDWPRTAILLISASYIAWDDRHTPPSPAIVWDGVLLTFCPGWPLTMILKVSASQVARITGMSHRCLACLYYFKGWSFWIFSGSLSFSLSPFNFTGLDLQTLPSSTNQLLSSLSTLFLPAVVSVLDSVESHSLCAQQGSVKDLKRTYNQNWVLPPCLYSFPISSP